MYVIGQWSDISPLINMADFSTVFTRKLCTAMNLFWILIPLKWRRWVKRMCCLPKCSVNGKRSGCPLSSTTWSQKIWERSDGFWPTCMTISVPMRPPLLLNIKLLKIMSVIVWYHILVKCFAKNCWQTHFRQHAQLVNASKLPKWPNSYVTVLSVSQSFSDWVIKS